MCVCAWGQVDVITWAQFREAMLGWMAPEGSDGSSKKRAMGADDGSVRSCVPLACGDVLYRCVFGWVHFMHRLLTAHSARMRCLGVRFSCSS